MTLGRLDRGGHLGQQRPYHGGRLLAQHRPLAAGVILRGGNRGPIERRIHRPGQRVVPGSRRHIAPLGWLRKGGEHATQAGADGMAGQIPYVPHTQPRPIPPIGRDPLDKLGKRLRCRQKDPSMIHSYTIPLGGGPPRTGSRRPRRAWPLRYSPNERMQATAQQGPADRGSLGRCGVRRFHQFREPVDLRVAYPEAQPFIQPIRGGSRWTRGQIDRTCTGRGRESNGLSDQCRSHASSAARLVHDDILGPRPQPGGNREGDQRQCPDSERLDVPVEYEAPEPGAEKYPHIYGPVPTSAVSEVIPVERDNDGRMLLPE